MVISHCDMIFKNNHFNFVFNNTKEIIENMLAQDTFSTDAMFFTIIEILFFDMIFINYIYCNTAERMQLLCAGIMTFPAQVMQNDG